MKTSFIMLSVCLTFSSLAQAQVSSQFELSGSEAKTIYKALKDETYWAVDKQKGYASIEVLDCTTASVLHHIQPRRRSENVEITR